jgi:hypothetical protein
MMSLPRRIAAFLRAFDDSLPADLIGAFALAVTLVGVLMIGEGLS